MLLIENKIIEDKDYPYTDKLIKRSYLLTHSKEVEVVDIDKVCDDYEGSFMSFPKYLKIKGYQLIKIKQKCNCNCHKEGSNIMHFYPCCNNGYL